MLVMKSPGIGFVIPGGRLLQAAEAHAVLARPFNSASRLWIALWLCAAMPTRFPGQVDGRRGGAGPVFPTRAALHEEVVLVEPGAPAPPRRDRWSEPPARGDPDAGYSRPSTPGAPGSARLRPGWTRQAKHRVALRPVAQGPLRGVRGAVSNRTAALATARPRHQCSRCRRRACPPPDRAPAPVRACVLRRELEGVHHRPLYRLAESGVRLEAAD
jgi:hypothetical protein